MKAYLYLSGTIFALFAMRHALAAYNNWSAPSNDIGSAFGAALIGICLGALSISGFVLAHRRAT